MLSFCFVLDVGGCIGDGEREDLSGWVSILPRRGRQNGCRRLSGGLVAAVVVVVVFVVPPSLRFSVAEVENDRLGTLVGCVRVGCVRVRVLQARRKDPNRLNMGSWALLGGGGLGDGGVTWQMGVFGGG